MRVANVSPGRSSTGSRLIVASAAPVTMFVAPGPTDVVHANVPRRFSLTGVAGGDVDHPLLVARGVVGQQVPVLVKRLSEPGDVAVPEDPVAAGDEPLAPPVALGLLHREEADQRLGDREATHARLHDDSTSAAQPPEHRVQIGQLDAQRARGGGGVEPRVARDAASRSTTSAGGGTTSSRSESSSNTSIARRARPDAVGVLAATAVQDAGDLTRERPPHQLGGVGGERRASPAG